MSRTLVSRRAASVLVLATLGAGVLVLFGSVAGAQPQTCPAAGGDAVEVTVSSPAPNAKLEGLVEVKGRFRGPVPSFQVELFVGDSRKDIADIEPKVEEGTFTLAWDTAGVRGGPAALAVVVCGGDPGAGSLVRGGATVPIEVVESPAQEQGPAALTEGRTTNDGRGSKRWVGLAIGVPGLIGLAYALGARPSGRGRGRGGSRGRSSGGSRSQTL